jgi:hypothetical protein
MDGFDDLGDAVAGAVAEGAAIADGLGDLAQNLGHTIADEAEHVADTAALAIRHVGEAAADGLTDLAAGARDAGPEGFEPW